jgi:SAM-dependent methyltransferase
MAEPTQTTYDEVPYESLAFHETHPDHLAVVARLHGLTVPDVDGCRVLELGCAGGGNLLPMAVSLPGATLLGVDLSRRQIEAARAQATALGITNARFEVADLAQLDAGVGTFDYIIAHGVFSWIDAAARERLLELCRTCLSPEGVAFVSYNAYPGWHPLTMLRQMMLFEAGRVEGASPLEQVRRVRAFLATLLGAMPDRDTPYAYSVRTELEMLQRRGDSYLLHEYLERSNQPYLLTEFVALAREHGLEYVADSRVRTSPESQSAEVQRALGELGGSDRLLREQYLDFLRNRTFRRSLLVHGGREVLGAPEASGMMGLRFQTLASPVTPSPEPFTDATVEFSSQDGRHRMATNNPVLKTALLCLAETWPRSVPFGELHTRVLDRLEGSGVPRRPELPGWDAGTFAEGLLSCYLNGMLEVRTADPPLALVPGEAPTASAYARREAEAGQQVTNLKHRVVQLTPFERLVLRQLDGERSREEVLGALVAAVLAGEFPLSVGGQPVTEAIAARQILDRSLEPCLERLRATALLTG